jgi:MerR family transcriptional regulator/heat shock protein HspR
MAPRRQRQKYVMISVVAERFGVHPQTLRMYEREGLITPVRSAGNTRLYDDETIERLEVVLTLTRDLGVNLAGVEVILNLKERLRELEHEVDRLINHLRQETLDRKAGIDRRHALVVLERGPLSHR